MEDDLLAGMDDELQDQQVRGELAGSVCMHRILIWLD